MAKLRMNLKRIPYDQRFPSYEHSSDSSVKYVKVLFGVLRQIKVSFHRSMTRRRVVSIDLDKLLVQLTGNCWRFSVSEATINLEVGSHAHTKKTTTNEIYSVEFLCNCYAGQYLCQVYQQSASLDYVSVSHTHTHTQQEISIFSLLFLVVLISI